MRNHLAKLAFASLLIAATLFGREADAASTRVALVIGNGGYAHATRLANPNNDASDISQVLRRIGFDVVEGRDLDKRAMEDKVREFSRKLDGAQLALFFYAGHGMQVSGKNYLIPVDARLDRPSDLDFETIDLAVVMKQMESEKRVNLVFLDACRDNPLARSFAPRLGTRSAVVGQGLASVQSSVGTMIAFATQPDAVALDGGGRNSPFTEALLKHVATPGVDIAVTMRRVRTDVLAATNDRQVPWDHSSLTDSVVLVSAPADAAAVTAALSPLVAPAQTAPAQPRLPALVKANGEVGAIAYSRDGRTFATLKSDSGILLWEAGTHRVIRTIAEDQSVSRIALTPDGGMVASAGAGSVVKLWDTATGRLTRTLSGHKGHIQSLAISGDGRRLMSADNNGRITIWDIDSGKVVRTITDRTFTYSTVAWSPDQRLLAWWHVASKTVKIWDVEAGKIVGSFSGHKDWAMSLAFAPNNKFLATGSKDGTVIIFDVTIPARYVHIMRGHTDSVEVLQFSADGSLLASGGLDNTVKLWSVDNGHVIRTFSGHTNSVFGLAFTPDGQRLASGSLDQTIRYWPAETAGQ